MENQGHVQGALFRQPSGLFRGPPAYQARTPWRPSRALLATVLIVGLSVVGAMLLPGLLGGGDAPVGMPGPGRGQGAVEGKEGLRVFAAWQVLAVVLTLLASIFFRGRARDVLALRPPAGGLGAYAGAILALFGLQVVLAIVQHSLTSHDMLTDLRPFANLIRGPDWALAAAVIGIGAPLSEELLFRGFLLSALAGTALGFWGAALVSTALWTALHIGYSIIGIIEVFIIGLFFSWLLWRTGSLRVAIFCHAFYNSLIVLALRFVELPAQG